MYLYRNPGVSGKAEVYTLDADGVDGGTEVNQDLFSSSSDLRLELPLDMFPVDTTPGTIRILPDLSGYLYCRVVTINDGCR